MHPRIVLIHAVPMAIPPITAAFKASWPEAEIVIILDDSLSMDLTSDGILTNSMMKRFETLSNYAFSIDAKGILFTCSAFGPAIDAVSNKAHIPVLKPNEAMFKSALKIGTRIGMLVTFKGSMDSLKDEFDSLTKTKNTPSTLEILLVEDAMNKLRQGDHCAHNQLIADAALLLRHCDALMLAQFSMAQSLAKVSTAIDIPVFTAPHTAVLQMKKAVVGLET